MAVGSEVLADDFRTAEVRQAQTGDLERILDPALFGRLVLRIEVVTA
jgi:hypothetical protein